MGLPVSTDSPHRRFNPLSGGHVLVSPHRNRRPWSGQIDAPDATPAVRHDPGCYLCPGNLRATGERNPDYEATFAFDNDFAAVMAGEGEGFAPDPLFAAAPAAGRCRVLCFHPDHSLTLALLPPEGARAVVDAWVAEAELLAGYAHVQVFENRGAMMGCSNPHPHGQVWATDWVPDEVAREDATQRDWLARRGARMLDAVAEREAGGPREVVSNAHWLAIVPFWAAWPFETLLLPRFPAARLTDLDGEARDALADILRRLTTRYDNLFQTSFPYSMGWHGAPRDADPAHWTLHAHFYPPLLRSASVRKFMVGFEMLAEPQRDLTPEDAAARLRDLPDLHYTRTA